MKKFGKVAVFFVFLTLIGVSGAFAADKLEVTGIAPRFGGTVSPAIIDLLNNAVDQVWETALDSINNDQKRGISKIDKNPQDLIGAFADASIYSSQGATQRGYGEPKLFAVTLGAMMGIKMEPGLGEIGSYVSDLNGALDGIFDEGDLTLGANIQALSGQVTLNMSRWLLDGLDLGIRFGMFSLPSSNVILNGLSVDTLSFGVVGNYQIVKEKDLVPWVFKWRGVSLGTGVLYQRTKINYAMTIDNRINQSLGTITINGQTVSAGNLEITPEIDFDINTATLTIPIEATTAVQLLTILNLHLGLGFDFAFGSNNMSLDANGDIKLTNLPSGLGIEQGTPGSLSLDGGGETAPHFFHPKVMTGLGLKMGPVIIDVPITYYFGKDTGASVGVTFGAVW